jgi:hypothetical protein
MKLTKLTICLLFIAATLKTNILHAKHSIGGYISYRTTTVTATGSNCAFTMNLYRDCSPNNPAGAQLDAIANISVYEGNFERLVNTIDVPLANLRLAKNNCNANFLCFEIGEYKWDMNLPFNPAGYTIIYQRCCRTAIVNNIVNSAAAGTSIILEITNEGLKEINNSPIFFSDDFPLYTCASKNATLNFASRDVNKDSLRYDFYNIFSGGGFSSGSSCDAIVPKPACKPNLVTYMTPDFDGAKPLGNGYKLNNATGEISGMIGTYGTYALGVKVAEYKNKVLLSRSYLDAVLISVQCDNFDTKCFAAATTATKELDNISFKIYPNPAKSHITIETDKNLKGKYQITNALGQVIQQGIHNGLNNNIDIAPLPKGIYIVQLKTEKEQGQVKFYKE